MPSEAVTAAINAWIEQFGHDRVMAGPVAQNAYGSDTGGAVRHICAALRLLTTEEVVAATRIAHQYRVPVHPISTGHNWGYGSGLPASNDCVLFDLSGMRNIPFFDADLGVVTVEPGVTQGQLEKFLQDKNADFLVPVTGAGPHCGLLSNALERGYGITPHADHFAAVTDIQAVFPDGSQYRSLLHELGGESLARLHRWGLGPFINGLFTQSGFGIVTQLSIQLVRRPESVTACFFSLRREDLLEAAVERIHRTLGSLGAVVGGINLMNQHRILSMTAPYPSDIAGPVIPADRMAALAKAYHITSWTGLATLYGTKRVTRAAQRELRAALGDVCSRMVFMTPAKARWLRGLVHRIPGTDKLRRVTTTLAASMELVDGHPNETALPLAYWRSGTPPAGASRDPARDGCGLLWYAPLVPMRPSEVREFTNMVHQIAPQHGIEPLITLTSQGLSLFDSTVPILFDRGSAEATRQAQACLRALMQAGQQRGWYPYRLGIDSMPSKPEPRQGVLSAMELIQRLKSTVDPEQLLAPGRYDGNAPRQPASD